MEPDGRNTIPVVCVHSAHAEFNSQSMANFFRVHVVPGILPARHRGWSTRALPRAPFQVDGRGAYVLTHAVLPVVGGRFDPAIRALTETYRYGPCTRMMVFIYKSSAHSGAAFPSIHVIMSFVIALMSIKRAKPMALIFSINAVLVLAATIYCGYHYVVDLFAAFVYMAILYPVGLRMERAFYRGPANSGSAEDVTSSAT